MFWRRKSIWKWPTASHSIDGVLLLWHDGDSSLNFCGFQMPQSDCWGFTSGAVSQAAYDVEKVYAARLIRFRDDYPTTSTSDDDLNFLMSFISLIISLFWLSLSSGNTTEVGMLEIILSSEITLNWATIQMNFFCISDTLWTGTMCWENTSTPVKWEFPDCLSSKRWCETADWVNLAW